MKISHRALLLLFLSISLSCSSTRDLAFKPMVEYRSGATGLEMVRTIVDTPKDVIIHINAPASDQIDLKKGTRLILFALPNGNSIEWTAGKKMNAGDDWHYDIQHIGAQTRWLRKNLPNENIVVAYLATRQRSWPTWKRTYPDYAVRIQDLVSSLRDEFRQLNPKITLNSHSGGGSFIFGYLDGVEQIPAEIQRLAFIDSTYGYEEKYNAMLTNWLKGDKDRYLNVLAYNDSVVVYNGKPLVSPTGGTWYRSKLMQNNLSKSFAFNTRSDTAFVHHSALNGRVQFVLKENPKAQIFHTHQVANNGFIFSSLSGERAEKKLNFKYWGDWVFREEILDAREPVLIPE